METPRSVRMVEMTTSTLNHAAIVSHPPRFCLSQFSFFRWSKIDRALYVLPFTRNVRSRCELRIIILHFNRPFLAHGRSELQHRQRTCRIHYSWTGCTPLMIVHRSRGTSSASPLSVDIVGGWWSGCSFACLEEVCSTSIASSSSLFLVASTLRYSSSLFFIFSSLGAGGTELVTAVVGGFAGSSTFFAME